MKRFLYVMHFILAKVIDGWRCVEKWASINSVIRWAQLLYNNGCDPHFTMIIATRLDYCSLGSALPLRQCRTKLLATPETSFLSHLHWNACVLQTIANTAYRFSFLNCPIKTYLSIKDLPAQQQVTLSDIYTRLLSLIIKALREGPSCDKFIIKSAPPPSCKTKEMKITLSF